MKVRMISLLILGFCLLSIVIGTLSAGKKQVERKACPATPPPNFLKSLTAPTGNKIALIVLEGVISTDEADNFFRDFSSAQVALKALKEAREDKNVKGVIFRINSPGGTVAMSQELYNSVLKLREEKPVIVSMADVTASGGYYIASAADRIYANPGTITGSIGVIMEIINARGLLSDKLGVDSEMIKSGKYKDTGNIYRPLNPDERTLLNNLVKNAYSQFVKAIKEGRINRNDGYELEKTELTEENLEKYADGRIFTGEQAIEYGFADKLGGLEEAEEGIKKIIKIKKIPVVNYSKPRGFEEFFLQMSQGLAPKMPGVEKIIPLSRKYPRQPLFIWE